MCHLDTVLTGLMEVSLVSNPVTRKPTYRVALLAKCPKIVTLDQQVTRLGLGRPDAAVWKCGCDSMNAAAMSL